MVHSIEEGAPINWAQIKASLRQNLAETALFKSEIYQRANTQKGRKLLHPVLSNSVRLINLTISLSDKKLAHKRDIDL